VSRRGAAVGGAVGGAAPLRGQRRDGASGALRPGRSPARPGRSGEEGGAATRDGRRVRGIAARSGGRGCVLSCRASERRERACRAARREVTYSPSLPSAPDLALGKVPLCRVPGYGSRQIKGGKRWNETLADSIFFKYSHSLPSALSPTLGKGPICRVLIPALSKQFSFFSLFGTELFLL